jgi:predicted dehydrogenase
MRRRNFLQATLAFPYIARSTVLGANDRVQIGFIGVGNRARWLLHYEDFGAAQAQIVAMSDIDPASLAAAAALQPKDQLWRPYSDYRRMIEEEKLDGVFVETPTHARALICLHALDAGLDVYAEKPVTLTVQEGQVLTRAVRRAGRVLQAGTQQRSMPIDIYASRLVSEGKIGTIGKVIVCNFLAPETWTTLPGQPKPHGLDWDAWCNQTELRPYHPQLHHGWSRWRDYDGGGESWGVSGWGTHSLDQVQAALGTSLTGPVEIVPDTPGPAGRVSLLYASGTRVSLEQEVIQDHQQLGAIFQGTNGRIQILRGDFKTNRPELKQGAPDITVEGAGENAAHIRNFVECIRSRQKPNADVEIAHRSTTVCHLINICRELQRPLKWDPAAERFPLDAEANSKLTRQRRKGYELPLTV